MATTLRRATSDDVTFLTAAVINAEKSGSETVSYCNLFAISESAVRDLLGQILAEEIRGQELYIPNFLVAEVDGRPAATVSGWVEQETGKPSSLIKSTLFMYFLGAEVMTNAASRLKLIGEVNIPREANALQIECVYTAEPFRGRGLAQQLIHEHIRVNREKAPHTQKAQVILLKNNAPALKAYEHAGFAITTERRSTDPAILDLLPCDTKILMERSL